jgi:hypothetical protein
MGMGKEVGSMGGLGHFGVFLYCIPVVSISWKSGSGPNPVLPTL